MSWRVVVINSKAKLSYKNNYLVVRTNDVKMIHLSEINTLIINSTSVALTTYLINELVNWKIKVIFCDSQRNPLGEIVPYYGCHNSSKTIREQISWDSEYSTIVWTRIITEKIKNQMLLLKHYGYSNASKLEGYISQIKNNDSTNREGHAAKVYFDTLFGMDFTRNDDNDINAGLNYGYSILLSQFNRELVASGCLTQLGIKHKNVFNPFNLSSDLMEPFRPLVDQIVKDDDTKVFDGGMKVKLVNVLNQQVRIKHTKQYVSNAISIYVKSVIKAIKKEDVNLLEFFEYEL